MTTNIFNTDHTYYPIIVKFKNRDTLYNYTINVLELAKTDKQTEYIIDGVTGEILYKSE